MPSRRWLWIRPTPHIYNYNRDLSSFSATSSSARTASSSSQETSMRSVRATSEAAVDRSSQSRYLRAATVAPEPGTSLVGYTGYYGKQLALLKEQQAAKRAASASASAQASAVTAMSSSARAMTASAKTTTVRKETSIQESRMEKSSMRVEQEEVRRQRLLREQEMSIKQGRESMSRAVRRAELHAQTSGADPRHVRIPRDISDDICKKVADICISPYDSREFNAAKAATANSKLKIARLEKELEGLTSSAMKYKSFYLKSASQMAADAMMAAETEAMASTKRTRKTVVEQVSRGKQVAAA